MNRYAEIDALIRTTDEAFRAVLHAALDGDRQVAREVLRGSAGRRGLLAAAQDTLRGRAWVPAPQRERELRFVADVGDLGCLVDRLARHIVAGGDPIRLSPSRRLELAVLLDAGGRRFRQLTDGPIVGGLDSTYRGCAAALFEVADHASHERSTTLVLCGALAAGLLQASRHLASAA